MPFLPVFSRSLPSFFRDFANIFIDLAQIVTDFARIFDKSKLWGALAPPASYTTGSTNERTANVAKSSSLIQTQLHGIYNDRNIFAPIQEQLWQMTRRTPMWQSRIHLNLNKVSKGCEWSACFHEAFMWWRRNGKVICERLFQWQRETDQKNVDVAPLEKLLQTPMKEGSLLSQMLEPRCFKDLFP